MNAKPVIFIVVIVLLVAIGWHIYLKGQSVGRDNPMVSGGKTTPTLDSIMEKGYDLEEAQDILDAIKSGKSINY
jgi:hypothetical protein